MRGMGGITLGTVAGMGERDTPMLLDTDATYDKSDVIYILFGDVEVGVVGIVGLAGYG